jgi:integrase
VFPYIGDVSVEKIDAPLVLSVLKRVEGRGAIEVAHKIKSHISQVMQYCIACGLVYINPARDLAGALKPKRKKPMASLKDPKSAAKLMSDIEAYPHGLVRCALKFITYTFVRSGELRHAEWNDFDEQEKLWRIPAEKIKMKNPHLVPLSTQVSALLEELKDYSLGSKYLFPSTRSLAKPISDAAVLAALRYLGYGRDQMTVHGFRSMASTLLNEQGYNRDWIERQLAHTEHNAVRAAYNYAQYLPERRRMMQEWADYLDQLRKNP